MTIGTDNTARVWDAATGNPLASLEGHTSFITTAVFSPDGQRVVTGSADNTARVWDAATGKQLVSLQGHTNTLYNAVPSPDGQRIVTTSADKTARVWDAVTGRQLVNLAGETGRAAAFSPDSKRVVTGAANGELVW